MSGHAPTQMPGDGETCRRRIVPTSPGRCSSFKSTQGFHLSMATASIPSRFAPAYRLAQIFHLEIALHASPGPRTAIAAHVPNPEFTKKASAATSASPCQIRFRSGTPS